MEKFSRILIVDDNRSILENFKTILSSKVEESLQDPRLLELEEILFASEETKADQVTAPVFTQPQYTLETAFQGEDAIEMVREAEAAQIQYDLIFMDIKMPPGIDGIETIARIWQINPDIEVVICTAFTDYSWEEIITRLGSCEHLLFLKKPVNPIEIKQMALSLTNKREADNEKKYLQNYLRSIIDSMPSIIISVDEELRIIHWNNQAEKLAGEPPGAIARKQLAEVFPKVAEEVPLIQHVIRKQQPMKKEKIRWYNGAQIAYKDIIIYPLQELRSRGAVIRIDDITNRVRLEEMMIQTDKMLSVGGLAAGMAHEINNPLANILQSIQLIQNRLFQDLPGNLKAAERCQLSLEALRQYMEDRDITSMLEIIRESGRRSAEIVKDMLSFSRKSGSELVEVDLRELIDKTVEMASNDYLLKEEFDFKQIKIIRDYAKQLPTVMCEKNNVQLVLLNILKNGAHAMAGKKYSAEEAPQFTLQVTSEQKYVRIEIEDNGPGIPAEIRKRIFEPFFTTKTVGSGTGLGLSVSYFIITKNHNGQLMVESEPAHGTRFIIRLPAGSAS